MKGGENQCANLEKAIVRYKHALQIYTRDAFPATELLRSKVTWAEPIDGV